MTNPSACETRWRAVPASTLAWREWDAEVVVYNGQTGSTHLLDAFAGAILRALSSGEARAAVGDLADALADETGGARDDVAAAIATVLAEFERLGLAHPDRT